MRTPSCEFLAAARGHVQRAAAGAAREPALLEHRVQQRRAERAGEMRRRSVQSVHARTSGRRVVSAVGVDPEALAIVLARLGRDGERAVALDELALLEQLVGERDARAAGEMVVTGASLAQRLALVDRA